MIWGYVILAQLAVAVLIALAAAAVCWSEDTEPKPDIDPDLPESHRETEDQP